MRLRTAIYILFALFMTSCSTTRVLQEGEYRLAKNNIRILNPGQEKPDIKKSELAAYIKQQPNSYIAFGWNPSLIIYNWSGKNGKSGKLWRKLGSAPVVYNSELVETSLENIKNHLDYIGYYGSKVQSEVSVHGKEVTVSYDITLGKRHRIDSIAYVLPEGREEFIKDFYEDIAKSAVKPGKFLSEALLEEESVRSATALSGLGYFTLNKNNYSFEADTISQKGKLTLFMKVSEFSRYETEPVLKPLEKYRFRNVRISRPKHFKFREAVLRDLNTIRKGEVYRTAVVNDTYSRLTSLKAFSSVSIGLAGVDSLNAVDCEIRLKPAKLQGFKADIEASSNSSGLLGISPQLTFFDKNIFNGGEWLTISLIANRQFTMDRSINSNEFGVSAGLSLPEFLGVPTRNFKKGTVPRTEFNISYNYQNRPEYTRSMATFSYSYAGNFKNKFYYQIAPVQLNAVTLYNIDSDFEMALGRNPFMQYAYQSHFDQGIGGMIYYTSNPSVSQSKDYAYFRTSFDISGNLMSLFRPLMKKSSNGQHLINGVPYSQYCRAEINIGRTWKFSYLSVASRIVAGMGYAYGNSNTIPFEKQFYVGGANSMRGWQSRALGPGASKKNNTFSIPSQTGDMKLEADLELRFPLFWKIEGAIFSEIGNVWNYQNPGEGSSESYFSFKTIGETIAADWGYGVRVNLDFLILRLDLGIKLYDPSRESKWVSYRNWYDSNSFALHFGVGYPF